MKTDQFISKKTMAANLCLTERGVDRWVKAGRLPRPSKEIGGHYWNWREVEAFIDRGDAIQNIYFIEAQGFIKIGISTNIPLRLVALSVGLPLPITLIHSMPGNSKMEKELHRKFKHLRSRGEWFRKEADLLEYINDVKNKAKTKVPGANHK